MKKLLTLAVCLAALLGAAIATPTTKAQPMPEGEAMIHIVRATNQTPTKGVATNFTGDVTVNRLFPADDPLKISGGYVTFQPKARTAWHKHPGGQMLIVTAGVGRVQQWGGPILEVREGDVVWFPAGVKHWHGATSDSGFTHISLADIVDGNSSEWLELVTDEQYNQS